MADVLDILCDQDGELICQGGDLVIADATLQHQADLLIATAGEYKQYPTTGVGLSGYLNDEDKRAMMRKIRLQFTSDKMIVDRVLWADDLNIIASY